MTLAIANLLADAIALHQSGDVAAAADRYAEILRRDARNGEALYHLAQICCQQGDLDRGIELVRQAVAVDPKGGRSHNLLGMALLARNQAHEALASFDEALACAPELASAHRSRGDALVALGRLVEAVDSYDRALSLRPQSLDSWCNRGAALQELGHQDRALESYQRAIALAPDMPELHLNVGHVLNQLGRYAEAMDSFGKVLALAPAQPQGLLGSGNALIGLERYDDALHAFGAVLSADPRHLEALNGRGFVLNALNRPSEALATCDQILSLAQDHFEALTNRANALSALGRHDEALTSYERALVVNPGSYEAHYNRACALDSLDRRSEALAGYEQALRLRPDHLDSLVNGGNAYAALGRHQEALAAYDNVLARQPDHVEAQYNRGTVLISLDRQSEALAAYERALRIKPDHALALQNRGNVLLEMGRVREACASYRQALAVEPSPVCHTNLIFALNFDADLVAADLQAERARWNEAYARSLSSSLPAHPNRPEPERRLRIGYMSGHFRYQAATYSFGQALLGHDREQFEVVCYSDTLNEDALTERLKTGVAKWQRVVGMSDERVTDLIRSDGIDILIDTVGHMSGNRLLVFARKPAPVQVSAWGEPTGTGLTTMDYILSDPIHTLPSERALMSEEIFDMPNFLGYWVPEPLPDPGPLPASTRGYVTFGSFNRYIKIQEPVLQCWGAILRAMPTARLVLKVDLPLGDATRRARIDRILAQEGIAAERVTLLGRTDRVGHFAAYQGMDIALDPFPHGGAMTTLDALWMGVPVITWPGHIISARLAAASLTALGLTDFIAPDPARYVDLAVSKAAGLDALARLRASLRERVGASVIGDPARYTQAVEAAYRQMWRRWCAANGGPSNA